MTTIAEDGTCRVSRMDGQMTELRIDGQLVSQALKFLEGDHKVSTMKLSIEEKRSIFKM